MTAEKTTLNYRYRLYPTEEQARHLGHTMFFIRRGWNDMLRYTRTVRGNRSRWSAARAELAKWEQDKLPVGQRAAKLQKLISDGALNSKSALQELNRSQIEKIWRNHSSAMQVQYGQAKANRNRKASAGSAYGSCWAQLEAKSKDSWQALWSGVRRAPRKMLPSKATWIESQIQGKQLIEGRRDGRGENCINLGVFFPPRLRKLKELASVQFIEHRRLPVDGVVKDLKVVRTSIHDHAKWYVVMAVDFPTGHPLIVKRHLATGLACGIDPGVKTAFTVAGEDVALPGQGGFEIDPGRPLRKASKKIAKLQRKYARQVRANNPHCFDEKGEWKRGAKLTVRSKNMAETMDAIASAQAHAADVRKDFYNKAAKAILDKYDTVYVGNWSDATPQQKGALKRKRKKAFAETGEQRKKGVAAQERTRNRTMRDNAPGLFRQILKERAKRSTTPKQVSEVKEYRTTVECVQCHEPTGPSGVKGLAKREWTCSKCGTNHLRDRGAAWNILQAGRASQADGHSVKGGSSKTTVVRSSRQRDKGASASRTKTTQQESDARSKVGRVSRQSASGKPAASSREALETPQRTRKARVSNNSKLSISHENGKATEPLANEPGQANNSVGCEDGPGNG